MVKRYSRWAAFDIISWTRANRPCWSRIWHLFWKAMSGTWWYWKFDEKITPRASVFDPRCFGVACVWVSIRVQWTDLRLTRYRMAGASGRGACSSRSYSRAKGVGDGFSRGGLKWSFVLVRVSPLSPRRVRCVSVSVRGESTSGDANPRTSGPPDSPGDTQKDLCSTGGMAHLGLPTDGTALGLPDCSRLRLSTHRGLSKMTHMTHNRQVFAEILTQTTISLKTKTHPNLTKSF